VTRGTILGRLAGVKRVPVTDLKSRLGHWLRLVKSGETVEVVEHAVPIARITAVGSGDGPADEGLERLLRSGMVTRAAGGPDRAVFRRRPIPCRGDVVAAIVAVRDAR
jgi:prevent-host-death family protein